jgi:hypothetical protein
MAQADMKSPVSYKSSISLWIDGRVLNSVEVKEYKRLCAMAKDCQIPLKEYSGNRLSSTDLKELFASLAKSGFLPGMTVLTVAGLHLEDQVSRFCLQALAEGYDTHLLCDVVLAFDKSMFQTHLSRLTQSGVVPSSLNQVALFMMAEESTEEAVNRLKRHVSYESQ